MLGVGVEGCWGRKKYRVDGGGVGSGCGSGCGWGVGVRARCTRHTRGRCSSVWLSRHVWRVCRLERQTSGSCGWRVGWEADWRYLPACCLRLTTYYFRLITYLHLLTTYPLALVLIVGTADLKVLEKSLKGDSMAHHFDRVANAQVVSLGCLDGGGLGSGGLGGGGLEAGGLGGAAWVGGPGWGLAVIGTR